MPAALVEQEEDEDEDESSNTSSVDPAAMPTFDVPYFRYIDEEGTEEEGEEDGWCSSRSLSSIEEEDSSDSSVSHRYAAVPAAPEKVLEHLLGHLRLDEEQKIPQSRETDKIRGMSKCSSPQKKPDSAKAAPPSFCMASQSSGVSSNLIKDIDS
ncbi:hypothetical protein cypCar_00015510 [Cyprinus carpio]|nr:hypothetical protein cypCar_00015510 [Cyprinus carpio]